MRQSTVLIKQDEDMGYEEWDICLDLESKEFYLFWDDTGFDYEITRNSLGIFKDSKWNSESSKIMIVGIFELF